MVKCFFSVLFFLMFSFVNIFAQTTSPKVLNFEQLAPKLYVTNDTLLVVNFWATWCGPCVEELPFFEQAQMEYSQQPVKWLFVSLDSKNRLDGTVIPFLSKRNLQGEHVLLSDPDANAWIDKVNPNWSGSIPATLMIAGDNRLFFEKAFSKAELFELLNKNIIKK